jgi:hypothetical protein
MRQAVGLFGLLLVAMGISGTIDHLARQPFMGPFLNVFNRWVIPKVDFLTGFEIFANLTLSVIGVIVIVIAGRVMVSK